MVGIVFVGNLRYCPYLHKYTEIIEQQGMEYKVIYWDRDNSEKDNDKMLSFKKKSNLNSNMMSKTKDFFEFKKWLNKTVLKGGFDKLVILSTLSGILIENLLKKKYIGKYILDIRDYSYESNRLFYHIENKLIQNSAFTCISSKGFKNFLPKYQEFIISHNFNYMDMTYKRKLNKKSYGEVLNIVWVGALRYFSYQKNLIDALHNDNRFKLIYHGIGAEYEQYIKYCKENGLTNIIFTGEYRNEDRYKFLSEADILNNDYYIGENKINKTKYAISNKYYDGLIFGIPQIVEANTYKSELIKNKGIGIDIDLRQSNLADTLYNYYFSIDDKNFNISCELELKQILEEDEKYLSKIRSFVGE